MSAEELVFLDVDDVIELHAAQLDVFGGGAGLRDRGLLESAIAQPQASFGDQYAHDGLFSMAAAYLFHIVSNHAFVDGNKRVGLLSALVFLDLNGITVARPSDDLYALTLGVAEGRLAKPAIAAELERIAKLNAP
jgi:death-on-curing protein